MDLRERILSANADVADEVATGDRSAAPSQHAFVLTCMDARLDPLRSWGLDVGDAHVVRNAGNVATDDVIRSLIISQMKMDTTAVLVIGHTDCGLVGLDEEGLARDVEARTGTRPRLTFGSHTDVEGGVRDAVERLRACEHLVHRDEIMGFVQDVRTGQLRPVDV